MSDKTVHINPETDFKKWFESIYEIHFERLFRYAFSITKDKQLAEDVVSEVFLNIWNNKPDYQEIRELGSYLHVSVKHLAIRQASRDPGQFTYSAYDESLQISDTVDPESLLLGKELEGIIGKIIHGLTPHAKIVYELSKVKGYTNQQIADELGLSKRTVESHLFNVLKLMKELLLTHFKESDRHFSLNTRILNTTGLILVVMSKILA